MLVQAYLIFVADAANYKSQVFLKAKFILQSHVQVKIWQNCQIKALNIYLKWKGYNKIVLFYVVKMKKVGQSPAAHEYIQHYGNRAELKVSE